VPDLERGGRGARRRALAARHLALRPLLQLHARRDRHPRRRLLRALHPLLPLPHLAVAGDAQLAGGALMASRSRLPPSLVGWLQLGVQVVLALALFAVLQLLATRHNERFDLTPAQ